MLGLQSLKMAEKNADLRTELSKTPLRNKGQMENYISSSRSRDSLMENKRLSNMNRQRGEHMQKSSSMQSKYLAEPEMDNYGENNYRPNPNVSQRSHRGSEPALDSVEVQSQVTIWNEQKDQDV